MLREIEGRSEPLEESMLRKLLVILTIHTTVLASVHARAEERRKTLIETHLYALQQQLVELEPFRVWGGGAIEPLGDSLLLVTSRGRLAQISRLGEVKYLGGVDVPMNLDILETQVIRKNPERYRASQFRIGDILLKEGKDKLEAYISHHYFTGECIEFRISSTTLELKNRIISSHPLHWKTVFKAVPCVKFQEHGTAFPGHHIGGRMLWDGEHHILTVIGDHEMDGGYQGEPKISLDPRSHLGKLVRIELDTEDTEILVQGLRVPQGLVRDTKGNIWETEHGPEGGDELNLLIPGFNYGWPETTLGRLYGRRKWPHAQVQGQHSGFTRPVYAWIPSIGVSAAAISNSQLFPLWKNDLLIASLRGRSLFRTRLFENRVIYTEQIEVGEGIRDIAQMQDGSIALLLDTSQIIFLTRSFEFCKDDSLKDHIYATDCDLLLNDYYQSTVLKVGPPGPIIRSRWNVYEDGNSLVYMKKSCSQEDIAKTFFLHVFPVDEAVLPEHRKQYGFDSLDFNFRDKSLGDGKRCIMVRQLPDYDVSRITTGQNTSGLNRWWIGEYIFDTKSPARID